MKYSSVKYFFVFLFVVSAACNKSKDAGPPPQASIISESITLNPEGYSPLTAMIAIETSFAVKVTLRVVGKHGATTDVVKEFDDVATAHKIPVLGLYADYENTVELTFKSATGIAAGAKSYTITTAVLPAALYPQITIDKTSDQVADGMTLVSYFGYNGNVTPQKPFIFDAFGDIRWYLDFTSHPVLSNLFYDDGIERLQNGNLYFGNTNSGTVYEMDFFGEIINTWPLPGYNFHHNVQEKPNGNFLVTVSKQGSSTVDDFIVEIDRTSKQIVNTWDLNLSLQYSRQTLITDAVDWIHVNAVIYDPSDNTIIISGRTQGLVKLDVNNNVVWIMGCHKGWGMSGSGTDLNQFLLQPLDNTNQPITDQDVLLGNTLHPDFEWNWYQHAPMLMPSGNIALFDNGGGNREFTGTSLYSRAVEFKINKTDKTVKQVWEYGKSRGTATMSPIVSDVDFLPPQNHLIFSPGAVSNGTNYGKVVEVDYATQEVVYEATLTPAQSYYGITFHRTERMLLYQ